MQVLVECKKKNLKKTIAALKRKNFQYDETYIPVLMPDKDTVVIRGKVDSEKVADLRAIPGVEDVWSDSPIEPFGPIRR